MKSAQHISFCKDKHFIYCLLEQLQLNTLPSEVDCGCGEPSSSIRSNCFAKKKAEVEK